MPGKIVKYSTIVICSLVVGWTAGQSIEDISFFSISREISISDILSIITNIALACFVTYIIERSITESRVEKDIFIGELDSVLADILSLESSCAHDYILSFKDTNYKIGRSRKSLSKLWQLLSETDFDFSTKYDTEYRGLINCIRNLDEKLTDSEHYANSTGFKKVNIANNHIYLNDSVKPDIDNTISDIKKKIFRLKIKINKK